MKIVIITFSALLVLCSVSAVLSGPEELSETQMTDVAVDDTVAAETQNKDETGKKKSIPSKNGPSDVNIITNPVNNPAEINKPEILRLDNQAADQRVNDQIQNIKQGINRPE